MSNNVTTAAQWGQVIDNLDSIKKSVLTQATGVSNELKTQTALLQALTEQKRVASEAGFKSVTALIQKNIDATNRDIRGNNQVLSNIARDIAQIDSDLNNAFQQKSIADAGPPTDNSTTPPETVVPGQTNTTVTIETPPPIENATVPATGQNAAADAAFQEANASPQQTIDPNSDPNTSIGAEGQDVTGFEPLTEPPSTADEFDNIDTQVANNENALQEPPQLSDEEIDQQIGLAAAQEETIAPQKVADEFDGIDAQVAANKAQADLDAQDAAIGGGGKGISTALNNTRATATKDDSANFQQKPDWRARLSLAPNANYLYKVEDGKAGILEPLISTDGVIFPYTPAISVTYSAGYDASDLIHSNYKVYQYKGSSVDTVSITADFTAQDTTEATYLLAVIHFFRSVTKMFYGQDKNPNNGVPPPLCYLSGFGAYTFDAHPLVVTNFTYTTPTEVDYIRAGSQTNQPGVNISQQKPVLNTFVPSTVRTAMNGLSPKVPNFTTQNTMINSEATYVPTKIQLQVTCIPIVTRNDISNKFSLREYATGALLRGSKRSGGGIW